MHKIINISEQQRQRAKQLYEFKTLKGSVTGGKGNIYGALGEIIVHDYYKDKGNEVKHIGNYDYDLLIEYMLSSTIFDLSESWAGDIDYDDRLSIFDLLLLEDIIVYASNRSN